MKKGILASFSLENPYFWPATPLEPVTNRSSIKFCVDQYNLEGEPIFSSEGLQGLPRKSCILNVFPAQIPNLWPTCSLESVTNR